MAKKFTRKKENFTCGKCSKEVIGNGYSNHCPFCLWGKHVDINPGDRLSTCGSLMRPLSLISSKGGYIIVHKCLKCGLIKKNRLAKNDNFDEAIRLQKEYVSSEV
jgi:hypothetical protein